MSVLNHLRQRKDMTVGGKGSIPFMETGPSRQFKTQWIHEGRFLFDDVLPARGRQFERDKNR